MGVQSLYERALGLKSQFSNWRRDFHMHPELGFKEQRTSSIVSSTLTNLGYAVRVKVGKTGVTADIGSGSPVIAIRADMDALPI